MQDQHSIYTSPVSLSLSVSLSDSRFLSLSLSLSLSSLSSLTLSLSLSDSLSLSLIFCHGCDLGICLEGKKKSNLCHIEMSDFLLEHNMLKDSPIANESDILSLYGHNTLLYALGQWHHWTVLLFLWKLIASEIKCRQ